jgi:putative colanic acid biosynthesis glycosyltransferase
MMAAPCSTEPLRILALNIRATQGGAGRMAYDLHHRLREAGHRPQLLYGYGSGIAPDPQVAGEPGIAMIGSRAVVLANHAAHLLLGRELLTAQSRTLREAIAAADIVHLHAAHHWYLHWGEITRMLRDSGKPVVLTAHDWWLLTGRCGFVGDCTGWQRACGECGKRRFEDLPAVVDRSRSVRRDRHQALRSLADQLTIICPSHHLARDHASVFPDLEIHCIPNALDITFENALKAAPPQSLRRGHLFCASDLAAPGKIDPALVRALAAEPGVSLGLIGRGNPFRDTPATDHGEVRSRAELAALYGQARGLLFSSRMDNAPLTIIEALSAGCYVLAYPSAAAHEMLALVGGRCVQSPAEALALVRSAREAALYGGATHAEIARRARQIWSGSAMTDAYVRVYRKALGTAEARAAA